jgi:hypothetical protein
MNRLLWSLFSFVLIASLGTGSAHAQLPGQRPAVSPYLNLLRRGSDPAVNYYDLVRTQIDVRSSITQLQQQVTTNQQSIATQEATASALVTGHTSRFLNLSGYFMRVGGTTPGTGGAPAVGAVRLGGAVPGGAVPGGAVPGAGRR